MSRLSPLILVVAVLGCGTPAPPPSCDAQSCNGCCDSAGVCQPGVSANACGSAGAQCQACAGSCEAGVCSSANTGGGGGSVGGGGGSVGGGGGSVGGGGGSTTGGGGGSITGGGGGSITGGGGGSVTGGGGGSVTGGGGGSAGPDGDTCNNPTPLTFDSNGSASFSGDNTLYANDGQGTCGDSRERIFSFSLSEPTWVEVSSTGLLAYHLRTDCAVPSSEVWCSSSTQKRLLQPGTHYLWAEASGVYSVRVRLLHGETCETATPILTSGTTTTLTGTLESYGHDAPLVNCGSSSGPDRAFTFTTTTVQNFRATVSQVNGFYPRLVLQALSSDCASGVQLDCRSTLMPNGDVSLAQGTLTPGRYVLWVKGNAPGTFSLTATLSTPTAGETCADPLPLTFTNGTASITGDTRTFFPNTTANNTNACYINGIGSDVVYVFTQEVTGQLTVNVNASAGMMAPVVYVRPTCPSTTDLACNLTPAPGGSTSFTTALTAGTYFLVVDSYSTPGPFTLTATQSDMTAPILDYCDLSYTPLISSAGTVTTTGTTSGLGSFFQPGTLNGCTTTGSGRDGVYLIEHPTPGDFTATITATGSGAYRPILSLRTNCLSEPTAVACVPNAGGACTSPSVTLTASALPAGSYYLIVDTCGAAAGDYTLSVTQ